MPKVNQEEYEVLKGLDDKGEWIARNYNGALITYTDKPTKNPNLYWDSFGERMEDRLFQFIQWEDESPYNIAELIEEYEKDYKGSWEHAIEFSGEVFGESQETEVKKNIEWLKSAIQQNLDFYNDNDEEWQMAKVRAYAKSLDLINQLDEPEVLSQELPVIPKFVADFIKVRKGTDAYSLKYILCVAVERNEQEKYTKAYDWISANDETFARAWLDGFTVEKEQKYVVELPNPNNHMGRHKNVFLNKKDGEVFIDSANLFVNDITKYGQYALTEEEIKKDFEWAWVFAKPVEEEEE